MEEKGNKTRKIIGVILALIVFCVLYTLLLRAYFSEGKQRTGAVVAGADVAKQADRLDVMADVQAIDPVKGEMSVRLTFEPEGTLAAPGEVASVPDKDVRVITNSPTKGELLFKKGQRMSAVDVTVSLFDGEVMDYPFDKHQSELEVFAYTSDDPENAVPISLDFYGSLPGLRIQAAPSPESTDDYAYVTLEISRSTTTIAVAVVMMFMLWLMSLSVLGLTLSVRGGRRIEATLFSWMGAMLFAFVAFRNSVPGAPPIGALIDYISFFWAEIIIAACVVTKMTVYLRRPLK